MRRSTYAIWWNEEDGPRTVGKLEIGRLHALFAGNGSRRLAIPRDQITGVEYRRGEVRIDRQGGPSVHVGSLDAPGALLEVVHSLSG